VPDLSSTVDQFSRGHRNGPGIVEESLSAAGVFLFARFDRRNVYFQVASTNMADEPREVKVVLLGDTGVGKSSLVLRFVTNSFKSYSESTIGASFMSKLITVDGKPIKFQIWDTAGQEKYHSLAPMYYRGAAAAIVVYDITRKSSFQTLQNWVKELKQLGPEDIVIAIAANKSDLGDQREVESVAASEYAMTLDRRGALFVETSAKEDTNVSQLFADLSRRLPAVKKRGSVRKTTSLQSTQKNESKCC
jgi:Ras-related protein Rab-22